MRTDTGTVGRGIYILDDYAPLRALTPALLASEGSLLPVRDALAYTIRRGQTDRGTFQAPNQPYGAQLRAAAASQRNDGRCAAGRCALAFASCWS